MADVERSIVPSEKGPIYQVKFPDMDESYLFQTILWSDITFKFNETEPHKSFFIKETVREGIPIQNCEFREMKDMSGNSVLLLGSDKVTDMPMIFVGMLSLPIDEECRLAISEANSGPQGAEINC